MRTGPWASLAAPSAAALAGRVAQRQAHGEALLGIAEEADGRAVAGIEDDAVVLGDALQRLRRARG